LLDSLRKSAINSAATHQCRVSVQVTFARSAGKTCDDKDTAGVTRKIYSIVAIGKDGRARSVPGVRS